MSVRVKIGLIMGWVIVFILWWLIFVLNLVWNNNQQTDIIKPIYTWDKKRIVKKTTKDKNKNKTTEGKKNLSWNNMEIKKNSKTKLNNYPNTKWDTFNILIPENLLSNISIKVFKINFKRKSGWDIKFSFYWDEKSYDKDLTYKLAVKDDSFDFAIVPAYRFSHLNNIENISFKVPNLSFQLSTLFDYNFIDFLKNNNIKAIPFAIDPIVWYSYTKTKLDTFQTFSSWKNIIINSSNRFSDNKKLNTMPILLGYDDDYLKYIEKNKYSFFPVFDFILHYYFFKNSDQWAEIIKEFWSSSSLIYKTFDFKLFQKYAVKYRKYDFCRWYEKFCILLGKKTNLVYWFASDYNFFWKNRLNIFKKFKIRVQKLKIVWLPIANFESEYPARWRIMIINPNSKNLKKLWKFIKTYILLWQNNLLPFYRNMFSPFNVEDKQKKSESINFLKWFLWKFLILYKMSLNYPDTLSAKEFNYLKWDIKF